MSDLFDQFLEFSKSATHKYLAAREGTLIVDCKKRQNDGGEAEFKLTTLGSLQSPFCLTSAHLDDYHSRQQLLSTAYPTDEPFYYLARNVLEILRGTGYGLVVLEFEKDKRHNTVFTCSTTFSHRSVIRPNS